MGSDASQLVAILVALAIVAIVAIISLILGIAAVWSINRLGRWLAQLERTSQVLLCALAIIVFMMLFPPWESSGGDVFQGHYFLFDPPRYGGNIHIPLLLVQILVVVIGAVGMIAFFSSQKKD